MIPVWWYMYSMRICVFMYLARRLPKLGWFIGIRKHSVFGDSEGTSISARFLGACPLDLEEGGLFQHVSTQKSLSVAIWLGSSFQIFVVSEECLVCIRKTIQTTHKGSQPCHKFASTSLEWPTVWIELHCWQTNRRFIALLRFVPTMMVHHHSIPKCLSRNRQFLAMPDLETISIGELMGIAV